MMLNENSFSESSNPASMNAANDNLDWTETEQLLLLRVFHEYRYLKRRGTSFNPRNEVMRLELMREARRIIRTIWELMDSPPSGCRVDSPK